MTKLKKIFLVIGVLIAIGITVFFSFFIALAVLGLFIAFCCFAFIQKFFSNIYYSLFGKSSYVHSNSSAKMNRRSKSSSSEKPKVIIDQEYKEKSRSKD